LQQLTDRPGDEPFEPGFSSLRPDRAA
jgi:hypothetical protein